MTTIKYITIDTTSIEGLKQAERLKARGWRIIRNGLFHVLMTNNKA